jgi:flagellar biosynthesis protein FlhG
LNLDKKTRYQTIRLFDEIADETDMLIADVPAGASDSSIAFVSAADKVLIVLVGEPTSFLDAYSLIKVAHLEAGLSNFSVVVNMTQSEAQAKAHFEKFNSIAQKFLDVNLHYVGHLPLSTRIRQSIVSRKPISIDAKDSRENACFQRIAKNLLNSPKNDIGRVRFFDQQFVQSKRVG